MHAPAPSAWILCCSTWKYFLELSEMLDGPCKGLPERLDTMTLCIEMYLRTARDTC